MLVRVFRNSGGLFLIAFLLVVFPSWAIANGEGGEADVFFHAMMSIPFDVWLFLGLAFVALLGGIIFLQWKK
jgi:hypothetical protein